MGRWFRHTWQQRATWACMQGTPHPAQAHTHRQVQGKAVCGCGLVDILPKAEESKFQVLLSASFGGFHQQLAAQVHQAGRG